MWTNLESEYKMQNPYRLIVVALVLLVVGAVLPFLMVNHVLPSTLALNLFSAVSSTVGFILGFIGIAQLMRSRR